MLVEKGLPPCVNKEQVHPGELKLPPEIVLRDRYTFADSSDDHITTLDEASSLLRLDELKSLAKDAKVQGKNKTELLRSFRRTSGKQTGLGFPSLQRAESHDSEQSNHTEVRDVSPEKYDGSRNRDEHFTKKILSETGPCIRLSIGPLRLFERVHLVFYRSTEWTEKSLITIILARMARRKFPEYIVSRSASVFSSRSLLLEFEASLRTQYRVDSILEFNGTPNRENLQTILDIFEEVYPRWIALLREEQRKEDSIYYSGEGAYLRRLSPAWVYTRIIHKGAYVLGLGKFKQHAKEHQVLSELLEQRLFHHARRGAWYQRKALLEEHYMAQLKPTEGRSPEEQKRHWKEVALSTCEQGLQDNLVHMIYFYDLQKRLVKIERAIKIPKRSQHDFGHDRLSKPWERTFEGIQIERLIRNTLKRSTSSGANEAGRRDSASAADNPRRNVGKTIWVDPAEESGSKECSVEEMCLSKYREQGWKGYHSEGGILRTLFALLFYDILFTYVPNVFQTAYQTCPLDLHTDAFYPTRAGEINVRLAEIANGEAARILQNVWERESAQKTCVVGLDWSFPKQDLLEIVDCVDGEKLATLCKLMAQEYAQRGGGIPDLFLWRRFSQDKSSSIDLQISSFGECCFAEVKSENDRLSDTQRLWIHVLSGAGIRVELCHAIAKETRSRT